MSRRFKRVKTAARVLGGVLAAFVLLVGLLASNSTIHQAFHQSGHAASSNCVLCLFAKGQVDSPEAAPVPVPSVCGWFVPPPWTQPVVQVDFSYLAYPSRAPPALALALSAVV